MRTSTPTSHSLLFPDEASCKLRRQNESWGLNTMPISMLCCPGDLFTALFLVWFLRHPHNLRQAIEKTVSGVHAILLKSADAASHACLAKERTPEVGLIFNAGSYEAVMISILTSLRVELLCNWFAGITEQRAALSTKLRTAN